MPGQVSDIYLAKDKKADSSIMIDAIYMFAQVDKGKVNSKSLDFDQWYNQKKNNYEIKYY